MPKTRNNGMTDKQRLFIQEYPIDLNATQAAIRAGYSERGAGVTASRLLTNPNVQTGIQETFRLRSVRTEVTQDMVLKELAIIAFADIAVYVQWGPTGLTLVASEKLPEAATRAVTEVSESTTGGIKFKLYDKIRALELLAKHLGILVDDNKFGSADDPLHVVLDHVAVELTPEQVEALIALDPALQGLVIDQDGKEVGRHGQEG